MIARVVVVGSSNTDMVVPVPHIPGVGETVLGEDLIIAPGGKGANQAVAAARLGAEVVFIGAVGSDDFGQKAIKGLKADGIDTSYIKIVDGTPSGVALIMVDPSGNNSIAVSPGANSRLFPEDIELSSTALQNARIMLTQLEVPLDTVATALELGRKMGCVTMLNPAPAPATGLPSDIISQVDMITPNEVEARALVGRDMPAEDLAKALLDLGVKTVILTLGERGALVAQQDKLVAMEPFVVSPVDTTAAGDAFSGALAVAIAEGLELIDAVRFANAAAALSVTKMGAQPSMPTRAELETFLSRYQISG